jgi:hypothetical protein
MKTRHALPLALALGCLGACDDKIAPWSEASSPQGDPQAPTIGPWVAPAAPIASTRCSLDTVNDLPVAPVTPLDVDNPMSFEGWVATVDLRNPGQFSLVLRGTRDIAVAAVTSVARYDVARAVGSNALTYAGYRIELAPRSIAPGSYRVAIAHHDKAGDVVCTVPVTLLAR